MTKQFCCTMIRHNEWTSPKKINGKWTILSISWRSIARNTVDTAPTVPKIALYWSLCYKHVDYVQCTVYTQNSYRAPILWTFIVQAATCRFYLRLSEIKYWLSWIYLLFSVQKRYYSFQRFQLDWKGAFCISSIRTSMWRMN